MPFRSSGRGAYGPQGQKVLKGPLAPVWVTFSPGAVGTAAFSYTFVATDDSGDAPTYSVASGNLPTGLSLNSTTGVLSGTASASGTFTYTLRATDVNGRSTDTTSISQVVSLTLYEFTSATFGSPVTGSSGPSVSSARSFLGNPAWANSYLNMVTNGVQLWTVPATGTYRIDAAGAQGGYGAISGQAGGAGSRIRGDFSLTQDEVIGIVVGQTGANAVSANPTSHAGAGGGTYVWRNSNSTLFIAAGGGCGGYSPDRGAPPTGQGIGGGPGVGSAGSGGNSQTNGGLNFGGRGGNDTGSNAGGGGGGGWGLSSNFVGGDPGSGGNGPGSAGGFGGGGGSGGSGYYNASGGGGGGGYTGGNGGSSGGQAGSPNQGNFGSGGNSFNSGSNQSNTAGSNASGNGFVIITKL